MSGGEFDSVLRAVGGIDRLIDWEQKRRRLISCATWMIRRQRKTRSSTIQAHENARRPATESRRPWATARRSGKPGFRMKKDPRHSRGSFTLCRLIQFGSADFEMGVLRKPLRDGRKEVPCVGGALDFVRAVLIDHVEAVLGVSREMVDHRGCGVREGLCRGQMDRLFGRWFLRHVFHLALSLRKARSGMSGKI